MKGTVYAIAIGILSAKVFTGWSLYATVIGIVLLANISEWLWDKVDKK